MRKKSAHILAELEAVYKIYQAGKIKVRALNGLSLKVAKGEFVVITGPSGCGKTTLLNIIGAIDTPTTATKVMVAGMDLLKFKTAELKLAEFRREKIGIVFQFFNLLPSLTAFENIELPLRLKSSSCKTEQRRMKVLELAKTVGLTSEQMNRFPTELSGGEQQRVAIARALANDPELVLLDEPLGNLDWTSGRKIMNLLRILNKRHNKTFILVTHDTRLQCFGTRWIKMRDGKLIDT